MISSHQTNERQKSKKNYILINLNKRWTQMKTATAKWEKITKMQTLKQKRLSNAMLIYRNDFEWMYVELSIHSVTQRESQAPNTNSK